MFIICLFGISNPQEQYPLTDAGSDWRLPHHPYFHLISFSWHSCRATQECRWRVNQRTTRRHHPPVIFIRSGHKNTRYLCGMLVGVLKTDLCLVCILHLEHVRSHGRFSEIRTIGEPKPPIQSGKFSFRRMEALLDNN